MTGVVLSLSLFALQLTLEDPPALDAIQLRRDALQKRMIRDVYTNHARETKACYESHECMFDGLCHWDWRVGRCVATKSSCLGSLGCLTHGACHVDPMSNGDGCHVLSDADCNGAAFCAKDFLGPTGRCVFDPADGICIAITDGPTCMFQPHCWTGSRTRTRCRMLTNFKSCAMWPEPLDAALLLPPHMTEWPGPVE
ncbi:MAG: hypothetical protein IV100_16625 [Myxococcales bacterium]|nr:hypothetical protein [Myxococcales bacterium]